MRFAPVLTPIVAICLGFSGHAGAETLVSGEVVARVSGAPIASANVIAVPANGGDPVIILDDGRQTGQTRYGDPELLKVAIPYLRP